MLQIDRRDVPVHVKQIFILSTEQKAFFIFINWDQNDVSIYDEDALLMESCCFSRCLRVADFC